MATFIRTDEMRAFELIPDMHADCKSTLRWFMVHRVVMLDTEIKGSTVFRNPRALGCSDLRAI